MSERQRASHSPALRIRLRVAAVGAALLLLAAATLLPGGLGQVASAAPGTPAFTATKTVTRSHLNADGSSTDVDTKTVTVSVSQTQALRGRQQIEVNWSGAHVTGGVFPDRNAALASQEEYPVVLLQCRGVDSPSAPAGQRLDPTTCWTRTPDDRYLASYNTAFPAWRTDRYAAPAERRSVVNAPDPSVCVTGGLAQRFVPFNSATGTKYFYGPTGTCGMPPEGVTVEDPAAPPTNNTYGATGTDGKGSAKFVVWTDAEHSSLGCSNTVPCALVVIPIMGISCDVTAATLPVEDRPAPGDEAAKAQADCAAQGKYLPGAGTTNTRNIDLSLIDQSVAGMLWWSASNWRNRITVPLTFGPPANVCDLIDTRPPLSVYGSEPAARATAQWAVAFCRDPTKFKLQHVRTGEPLATSALASGSIPAALVSRPPDGGYATPTVNAPIMVTGFAITYAVDDPHGNQYPNLKLTPRLIAKLLSESYWSLEAVRNAIKALPADDPWRALLNNPREMSQDPEFTALNPGIPTAAYVQSAASLLAMSGSADTMYALTSYLNADPEARAFLDGTPDPWGMVVNPKYKGLALPRESWPLLDDLPMPLVVDNSVCLYTGADDVQNVPVMPLISAPVATLAIVALTMQYAISNSSASNCIPPPVPPVSKGGHEYGGTFKAVGRESPGSRFVLGLTSLGDAEYLGLTPALLQSDASDVGAKFTNGNGRHFVAPTNESLAKAMNLATGDTTTHTWPIPYGKLRTAAGAYPGTMVVYAAVPTTGLDSSVAVQLGKLLRFAAGPGQQQGFDPGQVPPGFLPMTAANGLGGLVAYTLEAAAAVEAQKGGTQSTPPPPDNGLGSTGGGGVPNPGAAPSASSRSSPGPYKPQVEMVSYTRATVSALAGWAMPVVALVGLVAIAVAVLTPTGTVLRMSSSIQARLKILAELRSRT
jgi:hypothetical protein